jgi:L-2,4-diaminobutyrate decarboxylase
MPDRLPKLIEEQQNQGRQIMAVTANACATTAGLYDPLDEVGAVCNEVNIWFHVDGAHGASALLSAKHRSLLKGLERADSLIWDTHKMLRTPGLAAAVLVKDHRTLDHTFAQDASYLFHDKNQPGIDFLARTIECTKAGLGLKFFMGLAADGEQGLADYVEGRYALAQEAADLIEAHPRFTVAVEPESNIVCFRMTDKTDAAQLELRKKLLETGESYVSSTNYMGQRWLRFTFMNPATTLQDVEHTLALLLNLADGNDETSNSPNSG